MNQNDLLAEIFRINHQVDFDPEHNTLTHLSTGHTCALFIPASRCLLLLLEHQNSVVSQKELIRYGWGEHGVNITSNAFYQHIANIRRAFRELLPGQEIVVTIKRAGLLIPEEVHVTRHHRPPEGSVDVPEPTVTKKTVRRTELADLILTGAVLLSIVILGLSGERYHQLTEDNNYFYRNYIRYNITVANCTLYINKDGDRTVSPRLLTAIKEKGCDEYNQIYITSWTDWPRHSVLYCTTPELFTRERECVTFFYGDHYL
ncbi:winged helix-turn-helix domain-containing protein [Enterobacter asburiae]|uniref:winged helix-turn-helix domain-containing protein n=1 Tax=Scandinavium sp. UTDF21-P1B TaxID=3446379 RepID=UPI00347DA1F8